MITEQVGLRISIPKGNIDDGSEIQKRQCSCWWYISCSPMKILIVFDILKWTRSSRTETTRDQQQYLWWKRQNGLSDNFDLNATENASRKIFTQLLVQIVDGQFQKYTTICSIAVEHSYTAQTMRERGHTVKEEIWCFGKRQHANRKKKLSLLISPILLLYSVKWIIVRLSDTHSSLCESFSSLVWFL